MTDWKPGMLAVCIQDEWPELTLGSVYTVLSIDVCCSVFLEFEELPTSSCPDNVCDSCGDGGPAGKNLYWEAYFRPLDELEQQLQRIASEEVEERVPELLEA